MNDPSEKILVHLPPEEELEEEFVRSASGPGGQNVNKTATAVRLTFRFMESAVLSDHVKQKLLDLCGADFVSFLARESRSLPMNRTAARIRLATLLASVKKEKKKLSRNNRKEKEKNNVQQKKNTLSMSLKKKKDKIKNKKRQKL